MSNNAQKTPFALYSNLASQKKIAEFIQRTGKNLPCHVVSVSGSIVTVAFDITNTPFTLPNVTMPMFGPEWIRYPTQIGDLGVTVSADAYIGGISALGGGIADLTLRANLSALIWLPIASKNWSPTDDPNAVVIYGPNGGILRTRDKNHTITVNTDGITVESTAAITLQAPLININADHLNLHSTVKTTIDANGTGVVYNADGTVDTYSDGGTGNLPHPPQVPT